MPINHSLIDRAGTRRFVVLQQGENFRDAISKLKAAGFPAHGSYIVVNAAAEDYRVIAFHDFEAAVLLGGPNWWETPLVDLPVPQAARLVSIDTSEPGRSVLAWVHQHPGSIVVLLDGDQPVGLLTNPNLAEAKGLLPDISYTDLHGILISLVDDPRASFVGRVKPPVCPSCKAQDHYWFDTHKSAFICNHCGYIVRRL